MAEQQPPENESTPASDAPEASGAPDASAAPDLSAIGDSSGMDQSAIDELLKQSTFEDAVAPAAASAEAAVGGDPVATMESSEPGAADASTQAMNLPDFQQVMNEASLSSIDLLRDVDLNVKIELGRTRMLVEDVLKLAEGSVVELDKLAGDPVDVFVNERLVARGEVLVLNDNFCVRINEIVSGVKEEGL